MLAVFLGGGDGFLGLGDFACGRGEGYPEASKARDSWFSLLATLDFTLFTFLKKSFGPSFFGCSIP